MKNEDKVKLVLRQFPATKYSRALFFWRYGEVFLDVKFYFTQDQFFALMGDFAGIERELRNQLKTPEFRLKPEQDSKRYSKSAEFRKEYAKESKNN